MPFLIHLFTADEITRNWPTTDNAFIDALHGVWTTHNILPLPVYDEQRQYVEPMHVPSVLKGSLVELHFRLRHYFIKRETGNYDTFTGTMEQIIVLKRGGPEVKSPYRKDIRKGLFCSLVLPKLYGRNYNLGPFSPSHSEQSIAAGNFLKHPHLIPSGLGTSSKVLVRAPDVPVVTPSATAMSSNSVTDAIPVPTTAVSLPASQQATISAGGAAVSSGSGKKRKSKKNSTPVTGKPSTRSKTIIMLVFSLFHLTL
jgi:hypothetical protein